VIRWRRRSASKRHSTLHESPVAGWFTRLLAHMATIVRNTVRSARARIGEATVALMTRPNPKQQHALDLLATITL
jgi:hypothetical protein